MVDVDAHPDRAVPFKDFAELWRNPLWKEDWYARTNADEFDMGDFAQFA